MTKGLDDITKKREEEAKDRRSLTLAGPGQWKLLRRHIAAFAGKGRVFDHAAGFLWVDEPGPPYLALRSVCVRPIIERDREAPSWRFRIVYGPGPVGEYFDEDSVTREEWKLELAIQDRRFVWNFGKSFYAPKLMAEKIAIRLVRLYNESEET